MPAQAPPHSAKVIVFVPKPRASAVAAAVGERTGIVAERRILPMSSIGSGWYHDVAIQAEAKPKH